MVSATTILREQWAASRRRLTQIIVGLTDAEFFWELVEQVPDGAEISLLRDLQRGSALALPC